MYTRRNCKVSTAVIKRGYNFLLIQNIPVFIWFSLHMDLKRKRIYKDYECFMRDVCVCIHFVYMM